MPDSKIAARGRRDIRRDFPTYPTLPPDVAIDGFAFLGARQSPAPDLRSVRDRIVAIWQGEVAGIEGQITICSFSSPTSAPKHLLRHGLALQRGLGAEMRSFCWDAPPTAVRSDVAGVEVRRVELWWDGALRPIELSALSPISIATLWPAPHLTVHSSVDPLLDRASAAPSSRLSNAKISRSDIPQIAETRDLIGEIEAGLRAAEERTSLKAILGQLLRPIAWPFGDGGGQGRGRATGGGGREKDPGPMANLVGWLRWHSPLGDKLRSAYSQRTKEVEKLLAAGEIDQALRMALKLNGGLGQLRKRYPNGLPPVRDSLDFKVASAVAAPIMGDQSFHDLHTRYANLASTMRARGEYRHAAYIYSQLLGDHRAAVDALEAGGLFGEAVRLALASKLDAALVIRLLYLADELDAALAMAKRHACYDRLAEESRKTNPAFHAFVIEAWAEALVATGQPLRALQVTDLSAAVSTPDRALLANRARWLALAQPSKSNEEIPPEVYARSLLTAPWPEGAHGVDLYDLDFSFSGRSKSVLDRLCAILLGFEDDSDRLLLALLAALSRLSEPQSSEQEAFWSRVAGPVLEAMTRAILAQASDLLTSEDLKALSALLLKGDARVLAFDLSKLTKLQSADRHRSRRWRAPKPAVTKPPAVLACLLGIGGSVVWREGALLQLLDPWGRVLWVQPMSGVAALVAVGGGSNVIVVRTGEGGASLTRFSTRDRTFHPIGALDLRAWHDITSETQWLVQIGGEIGALDLAKLCAEVPEVEFCWSYQLTRRLQAICFSQEVGKVGWITRDLSDDRAGLVEVWTLTGQTELYNAIAVTESEPDVWAWRNISMQFLSTRSEPAKGLKIVTWSHDAEVTELRRLKASGADGRGLDFFYACDQHRPYFTWQTASGAPDTQAITFSLPDGRIAFTLEHDTESPMICLARSTESASRDVSQLCLMADRAGRLILVDTIRARRTSFDRLSELLNSLRINDRFRPDTDLIG